MVDTSRMIAAATSRGLDARLTSERLPSSTNRRVVFDAALHCLRNHSRCSLRTPPLKPGGRFVASRAIATSRHPFAIRSVLAHRGSNTGTSSYIDPAEYARVSMRGSRWAIYLFTPNTLPTGMRASRTFERARSTAFAYQRESFFGK